MADGTTGDWIGGGARELVDTGGKGCCPVVFPAEVIDCARPCAAAPLEMSVSRSAAVSEFRRKL